MGIARTTMKLVLAGALSGLLIGCGSSDSGKDYSNVKLKINEVLASNQTVASDESQEYDDWFEIYNAGKEDVDLEGFQVADSANTVSFPAGLSIKAGEFLMIWADDTPTQGPAHVEFKLSSAGDSITLMDPNGDVLDSTEFGITNLQTCWERFPDGSGDFAWCTTCTPGATNGDACATP